MFGIAVFAIVKGNTVKLLSGYDAAGNMCGFNNKDVNGEDMSGFPILFLTNIDGKPD